VAAQRAVEKARRAGGEHRVERDQTSQLAALGDGEEEAVVAIEVEREPERRGDDERRDRQQRIADEDGSARCDDAEAGDAGSKRGR
jgi:hypothetical protein